MNMKDVPLMNLAKIKPDVAFFEDTHTYIIDGVEVPSVTDILKPLHRSYAKVNPSVLEYAANRGKAVHEVLELYDLGGDLEVVPEISGYIKAYLEWGQVYRPTWTGVEEIVYYGKDYAGTLDRIGYLNKDRNHLCIVDIKTSQPTKEALVSVCLQTYAYAQAYENMKRSTGEWSTYIGGIEIDRYGLFLKSDGTYRFLNCKEYDEKYDMFDAVVWYELEHVYHTVSKILAGKSNGIDSDRR